MPATKTAKSNGSLLGIDELVDLAMKARRDVEDTLESLSRRAAGYLPKDQRKQVEEGIDRLTEVRDDFGKTVTTWRTDLEKQVKVIRGTVDKRVTGIRKDAESRRKKAVSGIEKEARKRTAKVFKRLQLPVRSDLDSIKRRLTAIERRITALEKGEERAA